MKFVLIKIRKYIEKWRRIKVHFRKLSAFRRQLKRGLPSEFKEPILTLLGIIEPPDELREVAQAAEGRRNEIASRGPEELAVWYSPKPGSFKQAPHASTVPEPGPNLTFTYEQIAKTGKNQRWASFLYLLGNNFGFKNGIELGTCAGISAFYLSSIPSVEKLITVEGVPELAEISRKTLEKTNAEVVNKTFSEAIDASLDSMPMIDFAYIDGHHEMEATIYYYERLKKYLAPSSVVIFDDISWSEDMRKCWHKITKRTDFLYCVDLGEIGVAVLNKEKSNNPPPAAIWDLRPVVGERPIGVPHGWAKF